MPLQICRYSILQQWKDAWSIIAESFHLQNERSRGFPRDKEFLDCSALISFNISDISVDLKLKWEYQVLASLGARWGQIRWQQRSDYPWIGTENYAWGHFFLSVCREARNDAIADGDKFSRSFMNSPLKVSSSWREGEEWLFWWL